MASKRPAGRPEYPDTPARTAAILVRRDQTVPRGTSMPFSQARESILTASAGVSGCLYLEILKVLPKKPPLRKTQQTSTGKPKVPLHTTFTRPWDAHDKGRYPQHLNNDERSSLLRVFKEGCAV
jgi:hypothetical protein